MPRLFFATANAIFVPCGLKIGDATSLKMYYVTSHKAWNYERALKRWLVAGIILLGASVRQETKIHKLTWSLCQPQKAPRQSYRHLKLRNFTLTVFKLRNTHRPFTEVLEFLRSSFSDLVACIALQPPSLLCSPLILLQYVTSFASSNLIGAPPSWRLEQKLNRQLTRPSACEK